MMCPFFEHLAAMEEAAEGIDGAVEEMDEAGGAVEGGAVEEISDVATEVAEASSGTLTMLTQIEKHQMEACRLLQSYDDRWKESRECLRDTSDAVHKVLLHLHVMGDGGEILGKDELTVIARTAQEKIADYLEKAKEQKELLWAEKARFPLSQRLEEDLFMGKGKGKA